MEERDLKERTRAFALRCMALADSLPYNKPSGRAIADQLVRSGSAVGANYRAACRARSRAEFVARLAVVEEEADESAFWIDVVVASGLKKPGLVQPLSDEADELTRIMVSSIRTARPANPKSKIQNPKLR
jgi:four helix bundle protein